MISGCRKWNYQLYEHLNTQSHIVRRNTLIIILMNNLINMNFLSAIPCYYLLGPEVEKVSFKVSLLTLWPWLYLDKQRLLSQNVHPHRWNSSSFHHTRTSRISLPQVLHIFAVEIKLINKHWLIDSKVKKTQIYI